MEDQGAIRNIVVARAAALLCGLSACGVAGAQSFQTAALADLSLEELANIEITSVSRRAERLSEAPASVYVITADEMRRSGVTSLPEALRLAPNLLVARIDASQYAISARGFNNATGNKLLVLVDGRTIYTPLFSGVFWDQQDVMLEDVERIEVISGPGATLWGANAVNGVINVITRPASSTQGLLLSGHGGNREHGASLRLGGTLEGGHHRVYLKAREVENTRLASGAQRSDAREHVQAGFRADWNAGRDGYTVQGDLYSGTGEDPGMALGIVAGRHEVAGANLLARWTRDLENGSEVRVQAYLDHAKREDRVLFQPDADIFDIEAQHAVRFGGHRLLWGGGYRYGRDKVKDAPLSGMRPMNEQLNWANVFVQAELRVSPNVELTPGIKLERNEYSGTEYLPSVRLAWKPSPNQLVWAAASHAVRAPSRFDRNVVVPALPGFSIGGPNFDSEVADVFELGYRAQVGQSVSYSLTAFRHEWDRLRSGTGSLPLILENKIEGPVYGVEGWASWQAMPSWRLSGGFATLRKHLRLEPGSTDPLGPANVTLANDPEFQWMLRSSADLGSRQELDIMVRRVGALPAPRVDEYTAVDLRYGWRIRHGTELSLTVQNLQERWHPEFRTSNAVPAEIERSVIVGFRWQI
jgi:iron complex outermembrane receptor protein